MRCITYKHKTKKTQIEKWIKVERENTYETNIQEKDPNVKAKQKYLDQLADLAQQYANAISVLKEKEITRLTTLFINRPLDQKTVGELSQIFNSLFGKSQTRYLILRYIRAKQVIFTPSKLTFRITRKK